MNRLLQNYHHRSGQIQEPLQVKNTIYLSIVISQLKILKNKDL